MKTIKRYLKIFGFILLLLLALMGIGVPIPVFHEDKFKQKKELIEEEKEEDNRIKR